MIRNGVMDGLWYNKYRKILGFEGSYNEQYGVNE
ncbi:hypothetical protein J2S07_001574 [Robertmurraya andreesenii]|uniref:Uncharacterized protein n=1 Tax=Anoxybacillus andreesenii TaxID=1325932 RepID=A0ABT9V2V8_9BACL|nr:hypothetical protein [Robertmurraya andreesenii]